jgi:hypothetical protein
MCSEGRATDGGRRAEAEGRKLALFTAYSLPIHCLFTAYSLPIHCPFTARPLPIHCLFTRLR